MTSFVFVLGVLVAILALVLQRMNRRIDELAKDVDRLKQMIPPALPSALTGPASADRLEANGQAEPEAEPAAAPASEPPPLPPAVAGEATAARAADEASATEESQPRDLESLIGGRWSVLLGGVAVSLGALFLVRYSIDAGLLGPAARIAGGVLLAAALLVAGEWLRRKDDREDLPPLLSADIPGVLTGAGAVAAFGTVFAAHAIYGFIGAAIAFPAMTAIGLACLLLAAVHGPKLAAIGLLGAYAAPLLTASETPNHTALMLHVLVVTASVMAVARIRQWRWLAYGAVVGAIVWSVVILFSGGPTSDTAMVIQLVGIGLIFAVGFGWWPGAPIFAIEDMEGDRVGLQAFIALVVVTFVYCFALSGSAAMVLGLLMAVVYVGGAIVFPGLARIAPWAALILVALAGALDLSITVDPSIFDDRPYTGTPVPPDIAAYLTAWLGAAVPAGLLALFGAWRAGGEAPRMAGYHAGAFALASAIGLAVIYLRIADWQPSASVAFAATLMAAACVTLTELFVRRRPGDFTAPAPAIFATAAIAFLALAMGVVLTHTWLPFGMALTSAGVAWVYRGRPLKGLPVVAVILAALAFSGLYFNAPFAEDAIGATPFLNLLIVICGLPAIALIFGGEWFRRAGAGIWAKLEMAIGLALFALFIALELRHFVTGGTIASGEVGLADMAVQAIAALGFAIGLQIVGGRSGIRFYDRAALVAGGLGLFMLVFGLGLAFNPLVSGEAVGTGRVFNLLLPGYLVTGILAALVALLARAGRPKWYCYGYGGAAGLLIFLYASLMVRHGFQGERLGLFRATGAEEVWTYSVVWLVLGGALLAAGLFTRSLPMRIASAAIIFLTILKVFLIDMSALTGALRAFSFIGLGLALLLIGRFYQRILTRRRAVPSPPEAPASG